MTRARVTYAGRVQGVGFRATAARLADGRPLAGHVRNLPDGRVELVAQGEADEVERFLDDVRRAMGRNITREHAETLPPDDALPPFAVVR